MFFLVYKVKYFGFQNKLLFHNFFFAIDWIMFAYLYFELKIRSCLAIDFHLEGTYNDPTKEYYKYRT
jgi:hypothetical protein